MLGFRPKLPISEDERLWVDQGFVRLEKLLGRNRLAQSRVILPTPEDFPDPYDRSPAAAEKIFRRVCTSMKVDRSLIQLEVIPDHTEELRSILPHWSGDADGCAGFYVHDQEDDADSERGPRMLIAVQAAHLKDPLSLVAVMAHELGHAILLGGGLLDPKPADHEPLTDLLTVFLGFGIFTANVCGRFKQWQDERQSGWFMQRIGYLSEEVFGYALAIFAQKRGEAKPDWEKHLSTNVRAYFKRSRSWLAAKENAVLLDNHSIGSGTARS